MKRSIEDRRSLKARERLADSFMSLSTTGFVAATTIIVSPFLRCLDKRLFEQDLSFDPANVDWVTLLLWMGLFIASILMADRCRAHALDLYDRIEEDKKRQGMQ